MATCNPNVMAWTTSAVTSMRHTFGGNQEFQGALSSWDVSKVTNMGGIFEEARKFNSDLSRWETSQVTSLKKAFRGAKNFNSDVSGWDVSKCRNFAQTFQGATKFNHDLTPWDVVSSGRFFHRMFQDAKSFDQQLCWKIGDRKLYNKNREDDMFAGSSGELTCEWVRVRVRLHESGFHSLG